MTVYVQHKQGLRKASSPYLTFSPHLCLKGSSTVPKRLLTFSEGEKMYSPSVPRQKGRRQSPGSLTSCVVSFQKGAIILL